MTTNGKSDNKRGRPKKVINKGNKNPKSDAVIPTVSPSSMPKNAKDSNGIVYKSNVLKETTRVGVDGETVKVADGENDYLKFQFKPWAEIGNIQAFPYTLLFFLRQYARKNKYDKSEIIDKINEIASAKVSAKEKLRKASQLFVIEVTKMNDCMTLHKSEWEELSDGEKAVIKPQIFKG